MPLNETPRENFLRTPLVKSVHSEFSSGVFIVYTLTEVLSQIWGLGRHKVR